MTRPSILPLLLLLLPFTLSACGSGDSGERALATSDDAVPEAAPGEGYGVSAPTPERAAAPAAEPAPSADGSAAARVQAEAAPPQFASADTAGFAPEEPETVPGSSAVSLNPMLVRTGQAVVQVDSLDEGIARVRALATRVGAVVGNTTISTGTEETRRAQMELRVPSINFDRAIAGLQPVGKVQSVNVTAEDVGEEYTDVSSRVANARRLEARLLDLLENRSGRLEEVLSVEREVARVREEIERAEGRMRYLRTRASVSLLTITLNEPQTAIGGPPGDRPIRDAFVTAWRSFVRLVAGLIASLGVLVPVGILSLLGWRLFRWIARREAARDAAYREALRRERTLAPATEAEAEESALRP